MVSLLGVSFVLAAAAGGAEAKPFDPVVEAALAFVTDFKGLRRLRGADVVARLREIVPVKETRKIEDLWEFEGEAAAGPVAWAQVKFEGPRLKEGSFRLRTGALMDFHSALAKRLRAKLGKPKSGYENKAARAAHWHIGKDWIVGLVAQKATGLDLYVNEWYEEAEN